MSWWSRLVARRRLEAQLDAELRDHLERQTADFVREGMTEPEARRRAALALGGLEQTKESCRDARGTRWLEEIAQDLGHGWRVLRQSPVFTLVAVLSLALGIGANTAIFTLVDSVLLRTLPVRDPQRLVLLDKGSWTNPIWEQIRDRETQLFEGATAWSDTQFDLAGSGPAEPVQGLWVSGGFFEVLGVPAILGRTIAGADDRRGVGAEGAVAVISYSFWQRRYGGAGDAVGKAVLLNRVPFTIVGVTPPEFTGPHVGKSFDVAVPLGTVDLLEKRDESMLDGRSIWWLQILARLKPGQSLEQATQALRSVQPQIREATLPPRWRPEDLGRYLKDGLTWKPAGGGASTFRDQYERPLLTLLAVVGLVLLVACANIANLLLARAEGRRHELAVRLAIGASRFRVARQLLTESLLLASLGAALGLLFAHWGSRLLVQQIAAGSEDSLFLDLGLDWRVLGFTAAVAVGTALLFGVAPAFQAGRVEPQGALREQGRTFVGTGRHTLGQPLVVAQVALSLVLVVGASLFLRTFSALAHRELGFDRDAVLVVGLDARRVGKQQPAQTVELLERAVEAVSALPGVARAGASTLTPVGRMMWNDAFEFPDPGAPTLSEQERTVWRNAVTPGWFATYGTRLVAGRDFEPLDREGAARVAVVNQAFVRKYAGGGSGLGLTVREQSRPAREAQSFTVVGVVEDAVYGSPRDDMEPILYLPLAQALADLPPFGSVSVRAAAGSPALLTKSVADAIARVQPEVSLTFRPLAAQVDSALLRERVVALLSAFFGILALGVAGIGLYGMTSYAVGRRRGEIGIRMALGADAAGVVRLVLGRTGRLIGLGVAIGTAASLGASRYVASMLYGLPPSDPSTLAGAALLLLGVGFAASWLPARQAARIDPARVLREG